MNYIKNKHFNSSKLILGITILVFGCIVIVYQAQNHWDVLASRGPIGDFLAGTIGPVINLAGVLLVYFSFHQQVLANKIQYNGLKDSIRSNDQTHNFNVSDATFNYIENKFYNNFHTTLHLSIPDEGSNSFKLEKYRENTHFSNYFLQVLYFGISITQTEMNNRDKSLLYSKYITFCKNYLSYFIRKIRIEFIEIQKEIEDIFVQETLINTEFYAMLLITIETKNNEIFKADLTDKAKLFVNITSENIEEFYKKP